MLTQEFLNVLFVALAVNGIVVIALLAAPTAREISRRRAAARHAAGVEASGIARPTGAAPEAGRPWFPDPVATREMAARDTMARDADARREFQAETGEPVPELASAAAWKTWLDEESARTARYHRPATIVIVELSGLDRLAERVGAAAADRLLPPVITTLGRQARAADRLARLGPTRFGILLVETDEVQAINYVERIRSGCDLWLAAGAVALRLSIGWAEIRTDRFAGPAFLEAEERMYAERRRTEPAEPAEAAPAVDARDALVPRLQAAGS